MLGFPEWVEFDTSKIVVCGHSFGGITALLTAHQDPRISACLTLDPWTYPVLDILDQIKL